MKLCQTKRHLRERWYERKPQGCLSRFIRAGAEKLKQIKCSHIPNKKDAWWRLFYLVCPMRFERTTFRVGVWHSIQLSYGHIFSLSIISGISAFCKGKEEKQKNIQKIRKKRLTFPKEGDKINKLSPTGAAENAPWKLNSIHLKLTERSMESPCKF